METEHTYEERGDRRKVCCGRISHSALLIYAAHFLSAWGDRMWSFSVGIYLVYMDNKSLRLTAIYGFSMGAAVLLFGSLIGDWVDRNQRLKVVRTYLFIQNSAVALCAVTILLRLQYQDDMVLMLNGHMLGLMEALVIMLAIVARLASVGCHIAIEKDWIVVVAGQDKEQLANLNARTRAIDQGCKLLSPLAVGQVMTFASLKVGAATIAGWNVVSMFLEYFFLWKVYKAVPELAKKKVTEESKDVEMEEVKQNERDSETAEHLDYSSKPEPAARDDDAEEQMVPPAKAKRKKSKVDMMFQHFIMIFKGWPIYMRQKVVFAGMSLAGLYMTVLGFDSITVGYAYALNVKEWILGICFGLAGVTGIIATCIYPLARKRIGLERTGLFAFAAEVFCLSLCVISIWTPGSPSDMYPYKMPVRKASELNCTQNVTNGLQASTDIGQIMPNNVTVVYLEATTTLYTAHSNSSKDTCEEENRPMVSVILFVTGIIASRVGLWIADLTVTQILQENVAEHQRGVVNGVQSSLNMLLDMLKFIMVIMAPEPHTFGILIIISFTFIVMSSCLFSYHSWRVRGHLFHFDKIHKFATCNGANREAVPTSVIKTEQKT